MLLRRGFLLSGLMCGLLIHVSVASAQTTPEWNSALRETMLNAIAADLERCSRRLETNPEDYQALSKRGDCHFFRGDFARAVADYSKMVELMPDAAASHWRRGIALYYDKQYAAGSAQFEQYHSFDNVDRENGIWRYFCQVRAVGQEQAKLELLRYEKDDREPFPDIYKLFSGQFTAADVLNRMNAREGSAAEKQASEFYIHLYVGLNAAVTGDQAAAIPHLEAATANSWGRQAGYGPRYMWHVGRLQLEQLKAALESK